jgi:hypothetical protein
METDAVKDTESIMHKEDTEPVEHIEDTEELKQDTAEEETPYREAIEDDEATFLNIDTNSSKDLKENEHVEHREKTEQIGETDHKVGKEDKLSKDDFEEAQDRTNIHYRDDKVWSNKNVHFEILLMSYLELQVSDLQNSCVYPP